MTEYPATQPRGPLGQDFDEPSEAPTVYSIAPNKPNCPRFWIENDGAPKKQSQFGGRRERFFALLCGGLGVGMGLPNTMIGTVV